MKNKAAANRRKRQRRRKVLPGFPWEGQFQTKGDVEAYFAGEKIQCLLCGKWFRQISTSHLLYIHNMLPDEYRQRYGLPWGRGLTGQITHKKMGALLVERFVQKGIVHMPDKEIRRKGVESAKRSKRFQQPYLRNLRAKNIKILHKHNKKWQRADYEAILTRIREQQRSLSDVCRDSDLPSQETWQAFVKKHPEFKERVQQIYDSWPYAIQGRVCNKLSPQFTIDCQRLYDQGMNPVEIAETLGVNHKSVRRVLRRE